MNPGFCRNLKQKNRSTAKRHNNKQDLQKNIQIDPKVRYFLAKQLENLEDKFLLKSKPKISTEDQMWTQNNLITAY